MEKWDYTKLETHAAKEMVNRVKTAYRVGADVCSSLSDEELIFRIYKELRKLLLKTKEFT